MELSFVVLRYQTINENIRGIVLCYFSLSFVVLKFKTIKDNQKQSKTIYGDCPLLSDIKEGRYLLFDCP